MYRIRTLNAISDKGLTCLPADHYEVSGEMSDPDAILVKATS